MEFTVERYQIGLLCILLIGLGQQMTASSTTSAGLLFDRIKGDQLVGEQSQCQLSAQLKYGALNSERSRHMIGIKIDWILGHQMQSAYKAAKDENPDEMLIRNTRPVSRHVPPLSESYLACGGRNRGRSEDDSLDRT